MSDMLQKCQEGQVEFSPCSGIIQLLRPRLADLGSFSVRRALPAKLQRQVGPWVFFDHAGPAQFEAGEGVDVRPHPHINLATVTYMFEGQFLHRDSIGSVQLIKPGDINLMVAGSGIVHSERTPPQLRQSRHRLHALQLWLALPEAMEEMAPAFYHYDSAALPTTEVGGVKLRLMMGSAFGLESPVKTFAETLYIEAHLQQGQSLQLPMQEERAVYIAQGAVTSGGSCIDEFTMAILDNKEDLLLTATEDCRIALIGGEKLSQRYIEWNFVSSRRERIEQAKQDWRAGRFATVPGDDQEFIPLP